MKNRSQTIEIFLPDGEPRGLRLAGITTRIVQAIQCPRTKLDRLFDRSEVSRVALYFLFGPAKDGAKPLVYIGQTEDLQTRLRKHHADKQFWNSVVAVTSRTESFTQVHVRYLEWLSIEQTRAAKRYALENGNSGGRPFIPEPLEADVLDSFETATTLLSTLGYPVFEPPAGSGAHASEREIFYCKGKLADGRGAMVEDGFVLFKGSLCRRSPVPSATTFLPTIEELKNSGLLAPQSDEQLVLTEDYLCSSVSLAASVVLARNANGWTEWRNRKGKTLDEVYRQSIE